MIGGWGGYERGRIPILIPYVISRNRVDIRIGKQVGRRNTHTVLVWVRRIRVI